jgi:hypothetical protein
VNKLSSLRGPEYAIELEGRELPYRPIYNLSEQELKVLYRYLKDTIEQGWIQESSSPTDTLILFILKKNYKLYLYVDYKDLNKITQKNQYPLSLINKILDQVVSIKCYIKIDLYHIYHQICIQASNK